MKMSSITIIFFSLLFLMFGCTKEQVYRSFYEGLTTHEDLKNVPGDPLESPQSYDSYESERKERLERE